MTNDGFVNSFLDYTKAYESPTEFFYWSAVAGVSAVLRDNAYMLLGDTRLYPNLYVLIVANPAMRKAKPLNSIIELVKSVENTKIIEGRTSIQAVIQRLGEVERQKNGTALSGASGIIFSEELSAMLTEDDANIPVLTDLYDFKSSYTSSLVSRGTTRLTNVVVTLLGASNEELLKPVFNSRAIYGGLLSRCLIVYGDKVRHRNSLMYEDAASYDPTYLKKSIASISKLKGLFQITDDARKYYHTWYNEVCPNLEKTASKTGAEGRIHVNVLKLAMVLAVSRKQVLEVDLEDVEEAIRKCQELFVNYRRLTLGSGKSKDADPQVTVLKILWEAPGHTLTRRELMARAWADISDTTLDEVSRTLLTAGLVSITESKDKGGTQTFKLTDESIAYFKNRSK